jgi:hypothetical protein
LARLNTQASDLTTQLAQLQQAMQVNQGGLGAMGAGSMQMPTQRTTTIQELFQQFTGGSTGANMGLQGMQGASTDSGHAAAGGAGMLTGAHSMLHTNSLVGRTQTTDSLAALLSLASMPSNAVDQLGMHQLAASQAQPSSLLGMSGGLSGGLMNFVQPPAPLHLGPTSAGLTGSMAGQLDPLQLSLLSQGQGMGSAAPQFALGAGPPSSTHLGLGGAGQQFMSTDQQLRALALQQQQQMQTAQMHSALLSGPQPMGHAALAGLGHGHAGANTLPTLQLGGQTSAATLGLLSQMGAHQHLHRGISEEFHHILASAR